MAFYDNLRAMALRQIVDKGRPAVLRRSSVEPVSGEPWHGTTVTEDHDIHILEAQLISKEMGGGVLQVMNENTLAIAAAELEFDPDTSDLIIDGSSEQGIASVRTIRPGPVAILHLLELSR